MPNDYPIEANNEEAADFLVKLRPVAFADPFHWLARGTRDSAWWSLG